MTNKKTKQKVYSVVWLYMANHGVTEVTAETPQEAIKQVWAGQTNKIQYVVSEKKNTTLLGSDE